jgi:uncharacterized pyridoxal phosphate-containing UPF0001 family protein
VHSVDRDELVSALADGVGKAGREQLGVLIQVSLDEDPARGGSPAQHALMLAERIAETSELQLKGLMAIPPIDADAARAYAVLAEIAATVREEHPGAKIISAGMSADLDAAISQGATHVRIGTALLGRRATTFR